MHRQPAINESPAARMDIDPEQPLLAHEDSRSVDDVSLGSLESNDPLVGQDLMTEDLARRETRAVSRLRDAMIAVLVMAAIVLSVGVYRGTLSSQQSQFQRVFQDSSFKIVDSFQKGLQKRLNALDSIALDLGSFQKAMGDQWPGVSIPDFDERGSATRDLVDAAVLAWFPIVNDSNRLYWEDYAMKHHGWIDDVTRMEASPTFQRVAWETKGNISEHIFDAHGISQGPGPYAPIWQTSPMPDDIASWVNFDALTIDGFKRGMNAVLDSKQAVLGEVVTYATEYFDLFLHKQGHVGSDDKADEPMSAMLYPVLSRQDPNSVVAIVCLVDSWTTFFANALPKTENGLVVVLSNGCGQEYTFRLNGENAIYVGMGDKHESSFDKMSTSGSFSNGGTHHFIDLNVNFCPYSVHVYPSSEMRGYFVNCKPWMYSLCVSFIFVVASFFFCVYDWLVERRQKVVMEHAVQSTAIVSSLFPEQVRERLFRRNSGEHATENNTEEASRDDSSLIIFEPAKARLKSFLDHDGDLAGRTNGNEDKPIADLFPNCTVLFADISGFTAWSSLRDPTQVFTLLEAVYQTFDKIARKRGVFKVETVGDSYVAVTGLPDPQDDHAILMVRFARDCRAKMNEVTRKLELTLGPDTGDLKMRFGLHSGPVTAGVLRGEKSRFQLFGDTVNTAARMESTGERDRIQLSQATADILRDAGKGHWLKARETPVVAKGKGQMQTYWFEPINSRRSISSCASDDSLTRSSISTSGMRSVIWGDDDDNSMPDMLSQRSKHMRMIDYNVDLLAGLLKQVVARRRVMDMSGCYDDEEPPQYHKKSNDYLNDDDDDDAPRVIDEVAEVIDIPEFNPSAYKGYVDPESIELGATVMAQLKRYVTIIASMYRNNPFHNFEHASHVTMSVNKLLQRVVTPEIRIRRRSLRLLNAGGNEQLASDLHHYTYGITSDPLTQLAVVFAALIHDVDHWGISNRQLAKEGAPMAKKYKGKSVAEQNSVDLAWDLLMDEEQFGDLLKTLFRNNKEYKRFRQVVVNVVMATDIFDRELGELRLSRWAKAFDAEKVPGEDPNHGNRKATIVIEHIMQASDVAHAMQHWHVYQRWNRRLFDELYTAYKAGRMEKDPSTFWVEGETKFFDGYIIPLAKKLKDCGVFGVASDECLAYATNNRKEWEAKGHQIVQELVENYNQREKEEAEKVKKAEQGAEKKKRQRFARRRSLFTSGG